MHITLDWHLYLGPLWKEQKTEKAFPSQPLPFPAYTDINCLAFRYRKFCQVYREADELCKKYLMAHLDSVFCGRRNQHEMTSH